MTEPVSGFSAKHENLIREREILGLFLRHLCEKLADQRCEFDSDECKEFAYFDIKLPWDLDDIDICVHNSHVVVLMTRQEQVPPRSPGRCDPGSVIISL
jgi:hypothetical protein